MITGVAGSAALAFAMGLRHGLDADHLAAIDGLTRWNAGAQRRFAPWCGVLFSAGHAAVILIAAVGVAHLASQWTPPGWLESTGPLISAFSLLLLSAINLRAAFGASHEHVPVGLRSTLFSRLMHAPRFWQVAALGALFALSFDAVVLATLFATTTPSGGTGVAAALALSFGLGMACVGAANGLWVARLLRHSDEASRIGSRAMTFTIALVGLLVGLGVLLTVAVRPLEQWVAEHEFIVSALAITVVLSGYIASLALIHRAKRAQTRAVAGAGHIQRA